MSARLETELRVAKKTVRRLEKNQKRLLAEVQELSRTNVELQKQIKTLTKELTAKKTAAARRTKKVTPDDSSS